MRIVLISAFAFEIAGATGNDSFQIVLGKVVEKIGLRGFGRKIKSQSLSN